MAENRSMVFGIIALIIGASGLGLGAFSVITFQIVEGPQGPPGEDGVDGIDGIDGINGTLDNLVAIWESLTSTPGAPSPIEDWIYFGDVKLNNSNYIILQWDRFIRLIKSGWYRYTIRFLWSGLVNGEIYRLHSQKNGITLDELERHYHNCTDEYYTYSTVGYIYSDGDDVLSFLCSTDGIVPFQIYTSQAYNQLVLEYVGE